jgi:hypothetical protein
MYKIKSWKSKRWEEPRFHPECLVQAAHEPFFRPEKREKISYPPIQNVQRESLLFTTC